MVQRRGKSSNCLKGGERKKKSHRRSSAQFQKRGKGGMPKNQKTFPGAGKKILKNFGSEHEVCIDSSVQKKEKKNPSIHEQREKKFGTQNHLRQNRSGPRGKKKKEKPIFFNSAGKEMTTTAVHRPLKKKSNKSDWNTPAGEKEEGGPGVVWPDSAQAKKRGRCHDP